MTAKFIAALPLNSRTPDVARLLLGGWATSRDARAETLRMLRAYWGADAED